MAYYFYKTGFSGLFFLTLFLNSGNLFGISLVYNMKIRRAFSVNLSSILGGEEKSRVLLTGLPICYWRDRHIVEPRLSLDIGEKRFVGGALVNLRYLNPHNWWLEATTGFEKERGCTFGTVNQAHAQAGVDDIIFTGGYNFKPKEHLQIVPYTLVGFPTNRAVTLFDAQDPHVGTRFFSTGLGYEVSYAFKSTKKESFILLFQNRFIHFYNRRWTPILPADAKIQPGNVTDFLWTAQYRYKKNLFETGYNVTLFSNQAVLLPAQKIESNKFIRNSYYASYGRLFKKLPLIHKPGLIGTGFYISRSKKFETKIHTFWLNFTVLF